MRSLIFIFCAGSTLYISSNLRYGDDGRYFTKEFNYEKITLIEKKLIQFKDSIPNDTLFICFITPEYPYAYFRKIFTTVCYDKACLPISITLFWSAGGDYLGYELNNRNILTKFDYNDLKDIPFSKEDYLRLDSLLDSPHSLLKNYELEELITDYNYDIKVDGLSGATIKDLRSYVIQGAAYTTYKLWHIVYGPSLDSIRLISSEYLSESFIDNLICSPFIEDNYFAFDNLKGSDYSVTESLIPRITKNIKSDNSFLKENSLDALISSDFSDSMIQTTLLDAFKGTDPETKLRILRILQYHSNLLPESINELINILSNENHLIIEKIFYLIQMQPDLDMKSRMKFAYLLDQDNRYVAKMAYDYLSSLDNTNDSILVKKIERYKNDIISK